MSDRHATGYVRVIERRGGPVYYAKLKLPDGSQPQRRLGKVWTKRTRPPAGFLTRAQAEARLQAILEGDDPLVNIAPIRVTFGRACDEWLDYIEHDRKRRKSTVRDYRNTVKALLLPAFGESTPLEQVTTADVDAFRAQLVREGRLSPRTINKSLVLLHGVFKRAVRVHGLRANPVEAAERQPERRSGDFRVLAPDEVALLAARAETEQDAALFQVAAFTGLRLGELLALRWCDVDFAKRLVHVRRSYVLGLEDSPKSHKVRSVPLIDQAARALDRLSRRDAFTDEDDRVFVNDVGEVLGQDLLRRRFKKALAAAGLRPMRLHDLRHTFGTLAVQAFPLTDVKAYMGHANIETTMIYVHHVPRHDAADKLTALVAQAESVHPSVHRTGDTSPQLSTTQRA
jgi:integrase